MTSPPPAAPHGGHRAPRQRVAGITRIVPTEELPPGVDALASADGKTIIVRASLDQLSRRRAMREVMASIRKFPRLALYPAISLEAVKQFVRRIMITVTSASQSVQQVVASAGDHVNGLAVAVTAAAGTAAVVTVVVATATPAATAPVGAAGGHAAVPVPSASVSMVHGHRVVKEQLPATPLHYLGVYEFGVPQSYLPVQDFKADTGENPNIALYYSDWNEAFKTSFADLAYDNDATPAVQIEPYNVSLADIASGHYDKYLTSFADQVADYGHDVIIGFAHEPDGSWYPWGAGSVDPATWVAAWQHVVTLFRQAGAQNVTWLWTMNSQGPDAGKAAEWWPGSSYVNWIGLDGYFVRPGDTFSEIFGPILSQVSDYHMPVLISETAVGPSTGNQAQGIGSLLAGIRADKLLGLIWFDRRQTGDEYHQDWHLADNPSAVRAFRADANYISS